MKRGAWLVWAAFVPAAAAASAPDWALVPADADSKTAAFAILTHQESVQYSGTAEAQIRERWVGLLNQERGRDYAKFSIEFNADTDKVLSAQAWVIDGSGKVQELGREAFLDAAADQDHMYWTHERILHLATGDRLKLNGRVAVEFVHTQNSFFDWKTYLSPAVHTMSQTVQVEPPPGDTLRWHASSGQIKPPNPDGSGGLVWTDQSRNSTPFDGEPTGFLRNFLWLQVRPSRSPVGGAWADASRLADSIIGGQMVCPPALQARARDLTATATTRWNRVRALTEWVQKRVVYLELSTDTDSYAGMRPHLPAEVAANLCGDCKDKAALLVTLLRAIGDDGRVLLVNQGDPTAIDPNFPTLDFNHAIVAIPDSGAPPDWPRIDAGPLGRMVVFDPTDSVTPLGVLSAADQGGWTLLLDPSAGRLAQLPQAPGDQTEIVTEVQAQLDGDGGIKVECNRRFTGTAGAGAYAERRDLRQDTVTDNWLAILRRFVPAPQNLAWTDQWLPDAAQYRMHQTFSAQAGRPLGSGLMALSPQFSLGASTLQEWRTEAEGTAWIEARHFKYHAEIKLPAGWSIDELPDDWIRHGSTVNCEVHYQVKDGTLDFDSDFSLKPGFYAKSPYEAIRRFLLKVTEAEHRPVVLRKA
ncbi:MAG TPA: transglutaminase domain-containing protein [Opitutaceae bacterium]|jgi:hypothetical protein